MPCMLWLGNWQLDKYRLQQARLADFANDIALTAAQVRDQPGNLPRFARFQQAGRYIAERQILIDNIVRNGRNGFFVITPLQLDDGSWRLVNRGWIAQSPRREPLAALSVDNKARILEGRVGALPVGGLKLGEQPEVVSEWPVVLQYPTLQDVERLLGQPLQADVLLLSPQAEDGFERQWSAGGLPPERHLGYAVQWFAMSAALTVLMLIMVFRNKRTEHAS
ncbi:MAG: SURF1 family protein [Pseudomonadota bacterium]